MGQGERSAKGAGAVEPLPRWAGGSRAAGRLRGAASASGSEGTALVAAAAVQRVGHAQLEGEGKSCM